MRSGTARRALSNEKAPELYLARSAINGKGVFARKILRARVEVVACQGLVLTSREVRDDMRAMQIGVDEYLVEDPHNPSIDDFINHSCEPNVGFLDGCLMLFALRDISAGEEIAFDYSTCMNEAGWWMKCRCRTPSCRDRIVGFDELLGEDRKRLARITLAYLRERAIRGRERADNSSGPIKRKRVAAA